MKNITRRDKIFAAAVVLIMAGFIALLTDGGKMLWGSKVDWQAQHTVIPEYFRQLFYDTGDIFPSFAPNLGAGENIYDFAYYGLYNPLILISYLLPFVQMADYIMEI